MATPPSFIMKGSCFCKRVHYSLHEAPISVNCCHCRNCQSLSGSAFAVNAIVPSDAVTVTSDVQPVEKAEDRLDKESSGSKSYHCPSCMTMLWATVGFFGDGLIFLRAGTLVESEQIVPDAHFFIRSKHPWIQIPEGVRSFETLPGREDAPLWTGKAKERFDAACKKTSS